MNESGKPTTSPLQLAAFFVVGGTVGLGALTLAAIAWPWEVLWVTCGLAAIAVYGAAIWGVSLFIAHVREHRARRRARGY